MDAPPHVPLHVRRSDLVGVTLMIAVAWITSHTSHPRDHCVVPITQSTRLTTRQRLLDAIAIAVAAVARFYTLSQTPLVLAVATYATTLAVVLTSRSSKEHPVDYTRNVCWSIIMICGVAAVSLSSVTDQQLTPTRLRATFTRVAVLQQLLVCAFPALCVLVWIHESHYAFARNTSWTRHIRRLPWGTLTRRDEQPSEERARAFAMLSGLAAACTVFSEKCLAEMVRTQESSASVLPLLTTAWIATLALESSWWHLAILVDPSQTIPLLHPYLCVRTMMGVVQGLVFFDEIHPDHALTGAAGLTAIFTGLLGVQFHAPIFAPKHDQSSAPLLLGASESLLDACSADDAEAARPGRATDPDARPAPGSYRPPAHFRRL